MQDPPGVPVGTFWRLGRLSEAGRLRTMDKNEHLKRHLELCQRIYERMQREGSWPWRDETDSPNGEDLLESEDN